MPKTDFYSYWDDEIDLDLIMEYITDAKWKEHRETVENYNRNQRSIRHHARITKDCLKLKQRLLNECGVNIFPVAFRVYASDKSAGAWNWFAYLENHFHTVGANEPIKKVIKSTRLELYTTSCGDVEVFCE